MSAEPLHRSYLHYSELPTSLRVLYTAVLALMGAGYLFALIYLYHSYSGRDGDKKSLSYQDVVIAYSGSGQGSKIEAALRGPMAAMLPAEESKSVIAWAQAGAERAQYESDVKPVIDKRCLSCHDGSNPHLSNLVDYDHVKKVTEQDTGADVFTLVRVSHVHLFGMTFIFFILGQIFSHAYMRPVWFKSFVVALPFIAIALDVSSWYLIKIYKPFAMVTMLGGGIMGMSFTFMGVVSMYQLWFGKTPPAVAERSQEGRGQVAGL
jgi:uncharacterized membrane protein